MTELLNVDPKEEDFECREEFPGTLSVWTGVSLFESSPQVPSVLHGT